MKFHENPSSGNRADACGQTDMTKAICAFHDYANAPKILCPTVQKKTRVCYKDNLILSWDRIAVLRER